jgi:hypothetical protein
MTSTVLKTMVNMFQNMDAEKEPNIFLACLTMAVCSAMIWATLIWISV